MQVHALSPSAPLLCPLRVQSQSVWGTLAERTHGAPTAKSLRTHTLGGSGGSSPTAAGGGGVIRDPRPDTQDNITAFTLFRRRDACLVTETSGRP